MVHGNSIVTCIAVFYSLFAIVSAQPKATGLVGRQFMYCSCSPTNNGFRSDAYKDLSEGLAELSLKIRELQLKRDETPAKRTAEIAKETQRMWSKCAFKYSMEECVNADVALRVQSKCYPKCMSFCEYDQGSYWNIDGSHQYGPPCDTNSGWKATYTPRQQENGDVEPSVKNPNPGPAQNLDGKQINVRSTLAPKPGQSKENIGVSSIPADEVETVLFNDKPSPRPVKRTPPPAAGGGAAPVAAIPQNEAEAEVEEAAAPVDGTTVAAPSPTGQPVALEPEIGEPAASNTTETNVNEGCVAVEHLEGYVMQYKRSFSRPVLCANDFCATPNHAIIVENKWTSMQRLCTTEWRCVESVKTVNNLNVFANRRVVLEKSGIIITPYDSRFPRWCSWVAQFAYEVLHLVLGSLVLGALTAVAILIAAAVKEY